MPHGIFDLVAGHFDEGQAYTVAVDVDGEDCILQEPVCIEAKTPHTERVAAISELIQLVTM